MRFALYCEIMLVVAAAPIFAVADGPSELARFGAAAALLSGRTSRAAPPYAGEIPLAFNFSSPSAPALDLTTLAPLLDKSQAPGYLAIAPASICANDFPLVSTGPKNEVCIAYINLSAGTTAVCTTWFVGPQHVATAGHCISNGDGRYFVKASNPGFICCKMTRSGACAAGATWRISRWVTTAGWLYQTNLRYDGAVLKVTPPRSKVLVGGVVQRWAPWPKETDVPTHIAALAGFPRNQARFEGCANLDQSKMYTSAGNVSPLNSEPTNDGSVVVLPFSSCGGISGGMVKDVQTDTAWGIQSTGTVRCDEFGTSAVGVVQITDGTTTRGGVDVAGMMRAIP